MSIVWTGDQGNIINKLVQTQTYSSGSISMLAYIYADMTDDYSIEQYIADAKNYFVGLSSTSLEINNLTYHQDFSLAEHHIYGSSRIGMRRYKDQTLIKRDFRILGINTDGTYNIDTTSITNQTIATVSTDSFILRSGITTYELTNHLGNVLATITDKKIPVTDNGNNILYYQAEVVTATDYYPFGMVMPERNYTATDECGYKYGFNGKENTDIANDGDYVDFGARIYDSRLGRWMAMDPHSFKYPMHSTFAAFNNNPLIYVDPNGKEWTISTTVDSKGNETVMMKLTAVVINSSSNPNFPMELFKDAVKNQIVNTYSVSFTKTVYEPVFMKSGLDGVPDKIVMVPKQVQVKVQVTVDIKIVTDESQVKNNEHVISVVDDKALPDNVNAVTSDIGGSKIKIKESVATNVYFGLNTRTIPHEIGHTLGLRHINKASEDFIEKLKGGNPQYNPNVTISKKNIMYTPFKSTATNVTLDQINFIKKGYKDGKLNKP